MDRWKPEGLSAYESQVWDEIQVYKNRRLTEKARTLVPSSVRERAIDLRGRAADTRAGGAARDLWAEVQKSGYLDKVLEGTGSMLGDTGSKLVPTKRVLRGYQKQGIELDGLDQVLGLDLRTVDEVTPRLGRRYAATIAAEGAAAGFVAGGGAVFAGGGALAGGVGAAPGAGIVAAALATDVGAAIGGSLMLAGHYGAYCGFDVDTDDPREQAFLLGVLGAASAGSMAAKDVAFTQTRQLAMMLVRRATWNDLSEKTLTKVVQQVFKRLSVRLTKQKFGQALPIAGAGIGASLNYHLLTRVGRDARMLYRERFLIEKYADASELPAIEVTDITIVPGDEDLRHA